MVRSSCGGSGWGAEPPGWWGCSPGLCYAWEAWGGCLECPPGLLTSQECWINSFRSSAGALLFCLAQWSIPVCAVATKRALKPRRCDTHHHHSPCAAAGPTTAAVTGRSAVHSHVDDPLLPHAAPLAVCITVLDGPLCMQGVQGMALTMGCQRCAPGCRVTWLMSHCDPLGPNRHLAQLCLLAALHPGCCRACSAEPTGALWEGCAAALPSAPWGPITSCRGRGCWH